MNRVESVTPQPFFTVFTPTYNRARTLKRVYDSLASQTFRDFEWLVVDDGSKDETRALIDGWIAEAKFPIRGYYQENQGKHVAWNRGIELAAGFAFLSIDSDDSFVAEALQVFYDTWNSIPESVRHTFTGVCASAADERGKLSGTPFPKDVLDSDSIEIRLRYKVQGEKWGFQRTDVLRAHPFPVVQNSSFVPESLVWFRIAMKYKQRFINRVLRTWYQPVTDGSRLTLTPAWKNPVGRVMLHRLIIDELGEWLPYNPKFFLVAAASYSRNSLHAGHGIWKQWSELTSAEGRLLWLVGLPIGCAYYVWDSQKKRRMAAGRPASDGAALAPK